MYKLFLKIDMGNLCPLFGKTAVLLIKAMKSMQITTRECDKNSNCQPLLLNSEHRFLIAWSKDTIDSTII